EPESAPGEGRHVQPETRTAPHVLHHVVERLGRSGFRCGLGEFGGATTEREARQVGNTHEITVRDEQVQHPVGRGRRHSGERGDLLGGGAGTELRDGLEHPQRLLHGVGLSSPERCLGGPDRHVGGHIRSPCVPPVTICGRPCSSRTSVPAPGSRSVVSTVSKAPIVARLCGRSRRSTARQIGPDTRSATSADGTTSSECVIPSTAVPTSRPPPSNATNTAATRVHAVSSPMRCRNRSDASATSVYAATSATSTTPSKTDESASAARVYRTAPATLTA